MNNKLIHKIKKYIRWKILDFKWYTDKWIIPTDLKLKINNSAFSLLDNEINEKLIKDLELLYKKWGQDPEITYYISVLHFMEIENDI